MGANTTRVVFMAPLKVWSQPEANSAPSVISRAIWVNTTATHPSITAGIHFAFLLRNARKLAIGSFSGTGQPKDGIQVSLIFTKDLPFR